MLKVQTKIKNRFFLILKTSLVFFAVSLFFIFFKVSSAQAATLYVGPASGSYNAGTTFSVSVYVSSSDQAINAVSGVLSYPTDKLEVTSVSKSGSVINLWVQDPSYSNGAGTVSFEGIVLNPGYKGSGGKIIGVTFRTKGSGDASVRFSSGSVLANDGQGTNILTGMGTGKYGIQVKETGPVAEESESPAVVTGTPAAPKVNSTTHPSPDAWYANNTPQLSWSLPAGTQSTRLLIGKLPQVNPSVNYSPAINSRTLDPLEDGVWYFHVALKNAAGWGGVTHYRLQIDTQQPDYFNLESIVAEDNKSPFRQFKFDATDKTSGIAYYEVQIDSGEVIKWQDDGTHIYKTLALGPGKHIMIIRAVDKAGNFLTSVVEFSIEPLEPPTIIEYPKELRTQDILLIKGKTYPKSQVEIYLQRERYEATSQKTQSDELGNFTFVAEDKLPEGSYKMWAEVINDQGARSQSTDKYTIYVRPLKIVRFGSITVSILSVIIPLLSLLLFLIGIMWYGMHKLKLLRKRVKVEAKEAEQVLHSEFDLLKKRIKTHVRALEKASKKRVLTKEEKKAIEEFKRDLDYVEQKVKKEIKDIEDQVK